MKHTHARKSPHPGGYTHQYTHDRTKCQSASNLYLYTESRILFVRNKSPYSICEWLTCGQLVLRAWILLDAHMCAIHFAYVEFWTREARVFWLRDRIRACRPTSIWTTASYVVRGHRGFVYCHKLQNIVQLIIMMRQIESVNSIYCVCNDAVAVFVCIIFAVATRPFALEAVDGGQRLQLRHPVVCGHVTRYVQTAHYNRFHLHKMRYPILLYRLLTMRVVK